MISENIICGIKFQILLVIEMKITFLSEDINIPRAKGLGGDDWYQKTP